MGPDGNTINANDMKKNYLEPEAAVVQVTIERNLLVDSTHAGKSTVDFDVEDIDAIWE